MRRLPARIWALIAANLVVILLVIWIGAQHDVLRPGEIRFTQRPFSELPGWSQSDSRAALAAFARSCQAMSRLPEDRELGGLGYAGRARDWSDVCRAVPHADLAAPEARDYFEHWFVPFEVRAETAPLFTGYYEPELAGSLTPNTRFRIPIYGRPKDLVDVDLDLFRRAAVGHLYGRVAGTDLVPYATRAEIDRDGLPNAPVLLYTDDPITAFFLAVQGSGRVRFANGATERLAFAATNGRHYTSIGHVLIARGAFDARTSSLQTIRAWLESHPAEARGVMEQDESFVFYTLAPLGDATLGSSGTEGVPLASRASAAVDMRVHPLGIPLYVATTVPAKAPSMPDDAFDRVLVAQDSGGAIKGATRADIFFGAGRQAEAIAGALKSNGRFFVLLPKPLAESLAPGKMFAMPSP